MKVAVISGGAGGLGRAMATELQSQGWFTVLLDLHAADLADTDTQTFLRCDLTDPSELAATMDTITQRWPRIDLAVYNAGITQVGPFSAQTDAAHRKVFEVNYFAAVNMARALQIPVRNAKGTHLAISSVAGFAALYHRTAYAASKHALTGFFTSLRSEERGHGVQVSIAAPSFVATNQDNPGTDQDGISRPGSSRDSMDTMTAQQAAAIILRGTFRGKPFIPVGRVATLTWWLHSLMPRLCQRLMERNIAGRAQT